MKKRWFLSLMSLTFSVWAQPPALPEACQLQATKSGQLVLQTKMPGLFLIYNQTETNLWVTHPTKHTGASAGWASKISPKQWSALKVNQDFELTCVESSPGHEQEIACHQAIIVCRFQQAVFPADAKSEFWVGEDMSLAALLTHTAQRGIQVPSIKHETNFGAM